ncbi:MAG: type IIA DNA topoisomerase subunit B [Planctomycetota bacterium]|nr:MAG: type IIA DNA topoisomerase subunit B [Planctomycetota bacterium]
MNSSGYSAKDIQVLEGLEPVRKRPAMYIGGTDGKGLHHMVWEIVDNAVDEYLNGHATAITVCLDKDGQGITVEDNGRGIPVDKHPKFGKSALELILTTLHSGAKFGEGDNYIHSGGLHGVGSSVVNALSKRMVATIRRDGHEWRQEFRRGKAHGSIEKLSPSRQHGTTIYFQPDGDIFPKTVLDADTIKSHLEDMSYIHAGLKLSFEDKVSGQTHDLSHPGGIPEFLTKLVKDSAKAPTTELPFSFVRKDGERLEAVLQWTDATEETVRSYVNGIRTSGGGTHEAGFRSAIVRAIRDYMETHDIRVKGLTISAEDIREGIVGVLSTFVREPQFQGQTKDRLNNTEMTAQVESSVRPALESWLNANKTAADAIVGRIVLAARARQASREAVSEVKRKSASTRRLNLPGKLADCKSTNVDDTELFLVEGDGAGGSAKQGRSNRNQAVLPLRGKILNSEGMPLAKALANQELKDLVSAMGTGIGPSFNLSGLRYGKIILLMDADADGYHISTLLLAFFFRHLPELIRAGHVYIAVPPLFRIDVGKETHWARNDKHKEEILKSLRANARFEVSRFKGLGEMDAKVLAETTLDPRYRTLMRVEIDSLLDCDRAFVDLLGKDPSQRYRFIMEEADRTSVEALDI